MSVMQLGLEIGLVVLLAVTLLQTIRLERALGVLRRARAGLEPLVEEFDASTRHAEAAIARLHEAAETAGRQVGRQTDTAGALKDDLAFLVERGERLADRIDALVRTARPLAANEVRPLAAGEAHPVAAEPRVVPVELTERAVTGAPVIPANESRDAAVPASAAVPLPARSRVRSQAERDLLKALRVAR